MNNLKHVLINTNSEKLTTKTAVAVGNTIRDIELGVLNDKTTKIYLSWLKNSKYQIQTLPMNKSAIESLIAAFKHPVVHCLYNGNHYLHFVTHAEKIKGISENNTLICNVDFSGIYYDQYIGENIQVLNEKDGNFVFSESKPHEFKENFFLHKDAIDIIIKKFNSDLLKNKYEK